MRTATRPPPISRRELARATLARQLLLERSSLAPVEAVAQLGAMQAQEPRPPFVGLWSRLAGFRDEHLLAPLRSGALVRGPLFRATLHLVTEADWASFRPACQPALSAALGKRAETIDLAAVVARTRAALAERPYTANELRALLHAAFPDHDERALGYAARMHVPLALVPTADRFGFPRDPSLRLAEPAGAGASAPELVLRYLAAHGPASVADAQEWLGLGGLAPAFAALREQLVSFTDERGRELHDLPDAPRPHAQTPAPARLLPEFDSVMLAHADRSRLIADEHRPHLTTRNLRVNAIALHDAQAVGTWTIKRAAKTATLELAPFKPLSKAALAELEAEALALLAANESATAEPRFTVNPPTVS